MLSQVVVFCLSPVLFFSVKSPLRWLTLACAVGMFSHFLFLSFFLLTSSFATQSPHSTLLPNGCTLLTNGHSHGLPGLTYGLHGSHNEWQAQGMTTLTCPHLAVSLHSHAPHHYTPRSCTHHVAMPLAAALTMSLCPSQLHSPCHCAPRGCTHHVVVPLMVAHTMLLHSFC